MIKVADAQPGDEAAIAALSRNWTSSTAVCQREGQPSALRRSAKSCSARRRSPSPWSPGTGAPRWDSPRTRSCGPRRLTASLYLKELYVADAYRRQRVGKLLMDGLYAVAHRRGLSRVEWAARFVQRRCARRSSKRWGPSRCRRRSSIVSPGDDIGDR